MPKETETTYRNIAAAITDKDSEPKRKEKKSKSNSNS
jgi:hypothetical protein